MGPPQGNIAKISRPRLAAVCHRARLFSRLEELRAACRGIWIRGLPGAGKTTLTASYLDAFRLPCLWYQLEEDDGDAANFFHFLSLAAGRAPYRRGKPPAPPAPENFLDIRRFALRYFRDLFQVLKPPFLVVLDNYQELPADSVIHDLLSTCLEQAPAGITLFFLSRTAPPPAMGRHLVNRTLLAVGQDELVLTRDEARQLAGLAGAFPPETSVLDDLLRYTQGWLAGYLLLLEHGGTDVFPAFEAEEIGDVFFNYFIGEIFGRIEPGIRTFLLQTACMPFFTAAEARELTGLDQAGRVLAFMHRKNYFLSRKKEGGFYQYHPIFREFLVARGREAFSAGERVALHRAAAGILTGHGQYEEAFALSAETKDWHAMRELILLQGTDLLKQCRYGILGQWLDFLPREMFLSDARLLFLWGQCLLPVDPRRSREFFARAFEEFVKQKDWAGKCLSASWAVETVLAEWGDFSELDFWIDELDSLLAGEEAREEAETVARAVFALFAALMFRRPQHPEMKYWTEKMFGLLRAGKDPHLLLPAGGYLSHYLFWLGDTVSGGLVVDILRELLKNTSPSPLVHLTVKMQEAVRCWHDADYEGCLEAVRQGLGVAAESGVHLVDNWLLAQQVYAELSLGRPSAARPVLKRMKKVIASRRILDIAHYHYLSSLYFEGTGDLELALEHGRSALDFSARAGAPFPEGLVAIVLARICHALGKREEAASANDRARTIGHSMGSLSLQMMSLLNEAWFFLAESGSQEQGRHALAAALALARRTGVVNFAGWHSKVMARLCAEALQAGIEVEYVERLVRRRHLYPVRETFHVERWPWRLKIRTLGRFELVVDGKPLQGKGKPQQKPLELLTALVAMGGRQVSRSRLEDLLWPEADGDRARQSLNTTLFRLRKFIGFDDCIAAGDTRLSFNQRLCWLDVWALETLLGRVNTRMHEKGKDRRDVVALADGILDLYQGGFLADRLEDGLGWRLHERLGNRFVRKIGQIATLLQADSRFEKAEEIYLRALERDPCQEEFYLGLMECLCLQGRKRDAAAVFQRCRAALAIEQNREPSSRLESFHLRLRQ